MIYYYRYLFVKMKVFNYSDLHFAEVTFYKIHTLIGLLFPRLFYQNFCSKSQKDLHSLKIFCTRILFLLILFTRPLFFQVLFLRLLSSLDQNSIVILDFVKKCAIFHTTILSFLSSRQDSVCYFQSE